jgi:hypothetical protein
MQTGIITKDSQGYNPTIFYIAPPGSLRRRIVDVNLYVYDIQRTRLIF